MAQIRILKQLPLLFFANLFDVLILSFLWGTLSIFVVGRCSGGLIYNIWIFPICFLFHGVHPSVLPHSYFFLTILRHPSPYPHPAALPPLLLVLPLHFPISCPRKAWAAKGGVLRPRLFSLTIICPLHIRPTCTTPARPYTSASSCAVSRSASTHPGQRARRLRRATRCRARHLGRPEGGWTGKFSAGRY